MNIDLQDIVKLTNALELVFNKKLLTKEEAIQFFPAWNNIVTQLEKHKRDILFAKVYEEEHQHPNPHPIQHPNQHPNQEIN